MAVFQRHHALRGFANVRNDILTFNRIAPDELGHGRFTSLLVIHKMPHPHPFEKGNAPTIGVMVGDTASLRKATETESRISGRVAIHAQKLAHAQGSPVKTTCS